MEPPRPSWLGTASHLSPLGYLLFAGLWTVTVLGTLVGAAYVEGRRSAAADGFAQGAYDAGFSVIGPTLQQATRLRALMTQLTR